MHVSASPMQREGYDDRRRGLKKARAHSSYSLQEIESMVSGDQLSSENVRRVERGSRIVTVEPCGSRLVFQVRLTSEQKI